MGVINQLIARGPPTLYSLHWKAVNTPFIRGKEGVSSQGVIFIISCVNLRRGLLLVYEFEYDHHDEEMIVFSLFYSIILLMIESIEGKV